MLQEKNAKVYENSKKFISISVSSLFQIGRITKYASQEKTTMYTADSETNSISPIPYHQGEK